MARTFLTDNERATLQAICDTLLPSLDPPPGTSDADTAAYWRRSAADLDVPAAVEETLWLETSAEQQKQIKLALALLQNRVAMLLLSGRSRPFRKRSLPGRQRVLASWATSPLRPLRQAFFAFKRLACFHFYAHASGQVSNPNARLLGYQGIG